MGLHFFQLTLSGPLIKRKLSFHGVHRAPRSQNDGFDSIFKRDRRNKQIIKKHSLVIISTSSKGTGTV